MDVLSKHIKDLISSNEGRRALDKLREEAEKPSPASSTPTAESIEVEHQGKFLIRPVRPS